MGPQILGEAVAPGVTWPDNARISASQQHVACRLAAGQSVVDISRELNVATRTIFHWLSTPEYKLYVRNLRSALLEEAVGRLSGGATRCVDTLLSLLDDPDPGIRLRSAVSGLQLLGGLRGVVEMADRVEQLERNVAARALEFEAEMVQDDDHPDPVPDNAHERLFRKDIDGDGGVNGRVA
jgi:hypothetical protein